MKTVQEERIELIIKSLRRELSEARNRAIDDCIDVLLDKTTELGMDKKFSYRECKLMFEQLKKWTD